MTKRFSRLFLMGLMMLAGQALANGKIAIIDFQKAILTTDAAKARIAKLEAEPAYKDNINRAKKLTEDYQATVLQYQKEEPLMSVEKKTEMQGKIRDLESDIKHLQTKVQEQSKQSLAPLVLGMQAKAQQEVAKI